MLILIKPDRMIHREELATAVLYNIWLEQT